MELVIKDMPDAKGNDLRNGNFQRNGTGRQDTNHQNSDLALYLPTNGIKVGGILKTVFGGILTGTFGIATMVVGGIGAGFSSSVMLGISAVLAAFTVGGGILLGQGCSSLTSLSRRNQVYQGSWHSHLLQFPAAGTGSRQAGEICKKRYQTYDKQRLVPSGTC